MDIVKRLATLFNRSAETAVERLVGHCQRHPDYKSCLTTWENSFVECLLQTWRKLPEFTLSDVQLRHLTDVLAKLDDRALHRLARRK